ncbi:MAG TPA: VWA domain-containing protein [Actinomycetota bacterium]|nr:VWA domain-containing protein [Actinomycetota bacterium]
MLDRLLEFTHALRDAGVPVSSAEGIDAARSLRFVPFESRDAFKGALAATLVKSPSHRAAFDTLFTLYFESGLEERPDASGGGRGDVRSELAEALVSGDGSALGDLAVQAVERLGRVENSPSGSLFFEYPVFRALDLGRLRSRVERDAAALSPLERRLLLDAFDERVRVFSGAVTDEVRKRVVRRRGPEAVARYAVPAVLEDLDLLTATADEMAELRRAVRPLARRLAVKLTMKRRRASRGRLDVRRTVRHSLSAGGVPVEAFFRKRPPHRPELFVLCDVSSSVASFSRFSLMLVHALASEFQRVRSFAFVDTVDEVTSFFEDEDFARAADRLRREAKVVRIDSNSNYGAALEAFVERFGDDLGPKATVLVLGDARNNNRPPREHNLAAIAERARHTYWLNPESLVYWDSGDSLASLYAAHVDKMVEVRNLRQLEDFVVRTLTN